MARPRRSIECPREPVALSAAEAAAFMGVSEGTFREAVERGLFPAPRELLGRVLWDAEELHTAFRRLPRQGEVPQSAGPAGIDWRKPAA
jgi:predicted DNA-binding transcriptional regulator AlpA